MDEKMKKDKVLCEGVDQRRMMGNGFWIMDGDLENFIWLDGNIKRSKLAHTLKGGGVMEEKWFF